ncbi:MULTISPECIES: hypothetical protein [unclassified Streptomyces]|nr:MULTISPECIES: hypothetical protein [unclassified Streptomyces]MDI9830640.1 hypothetical protein [Streptomyces sp. KAU_LT]
MRNVLLTVVYVLIVVPVGLVLRVVRDPMRRSWSRRRESYWHKPLTRG